MKLKSILLTWSGFAVLAENDSSPDKKLKQTNFECLEVNLMNDFAFKKRKLFKHVRPMDIGHLSTTRSLLGEYWRVFTPADTKAIIDKLIIGNDPYVHANYMIAARRLAYGWGQETHRSNCSVPGYEFFSDNCMYKYKLDLCCYLVTKFVRIFVVVAR